MEKSIKIVIISVIIIFTIIGTYLVFLRSINCKDEFCFQNALISCKRSTFINIQEKATWEYIIIGQTSDSCIVKVRNLHMDIIEAKKIEGKTMICYTQKGFSIFPEERLDLCKGELKEEIQEIIIQKLHNYITNNIGQIKEELKKPY